MPTTTRAHARGHQRVGAGRACGPCARRARAWSRRWRPAPRRRPARARPPPREPDPAAGSRPRRCDRRHSRSRIPPTGWGGRWRAPMRPARSPGAWPARRPPPSSVVARGLFGQQLRARGAGCRARRRGTRPRPSATPACSGRCTGRSCPRRRARAGPCRGSPRACRGPGREPRARAPGGCPRA